MSRWLAMAGAILCTTACVDVLQGIPCQTNADCAEYVCVSAKCTDPGSGSSGSNPGSTEGALTVSVYAVTGDTNGDGQLSPGESGGLIIRIINGGSRVLGLSGNLSTTQAGVTVTNGQGIKFGDIGYGGGPCGNATSAGSCSSSSVSYPQVSLTTALAVGTVIPFQLAVTDSLGNSFGALAFSLTVASIGDSLTASVYAVTGDSNGDGQLSPGESGGLIIRIINGGSRVLGLSGNLSTTQAGVTVTNGQGIKFGDIGYGGGPCGNATSAGSCSSASVSYPQVSLTTALAVGTVIPFQLTVTDSLGNSFGALAFSLTVASIGDSLTASVYAVTGDSNRDGRLSPGESGGLIIRIINGGSRVLGLSGNLSTTQAGVTVTNGQGIKFGDIGYGGGPCGNATSAGSCSSVSASYPQVSLSTAVAAGTVIPFQLTVTDSLGNSFGALSFSLTVQ